MVCHKSERGNGSGETRASDSAGAGAAEPRDPDGEEEQRTGRSRCDPSTGCAAAQPEGANAPRKGRGPAPGTRPVTWTNHSQVGQGVPAGARHVRSDYRRR